MLTGSTGTSLVPASNSAVKFRRQAQYHRFPSQKKFDELTATFIGFSGPIGSGKSKALVMQAIKLAYLNRGVPGLIGSPTYRMLTDSTLVELVATLEELQIPFKWYKQDYKIHLPEPGSTILLRTMDDPERLRAMNLGWFGVDELSYCREESWTRLEGRLRHPQAKVKCGFAVWTPKGRDWVWRRFISTRKTPSYQVVQAKPFENRAILDSTPNFYENLKQSYDDKFYRQEVLGEYLDMSSGPVYHSFSEHNLQPGSFDPSRPLVWSMDFNVNPMSAVILQCADYYARQTVHVLSEIVLPDSNTEEMCREFVRRTKPWADAIGKPIELRVYGDASGGNRSTSGNSNWRIVEQFMAGQPGYKVSYRYERKNPAVLDRINAVNALLCSFGQGHKSAGERYLYIDPQCRELITDLEDIKWKVDAHGNTYPELDKSDPKRTHVSDALGYYCWVEHGFQVKAHASKQIF